MNRTSEDRHEGLGGDNRETLKPDIKGTSYAQPIITSAIAKIIASGALKSYSYPLLKSKNPQTRESLRQQQFDMIQQLSASGIDPVMFDVMLSNELDRRLKQQFGFIFLGLTSIFTAAAYAIVVINGVYNIGISSAAITALVVETPIQFIGLLYVIARNLFPQSLADRVAAHGTKTRHNDPAMD